jgi:hypothetical protein
VTCEPHSMDPARSGMVRTITTTMQTICCIDGCLRLVHPRVTEMKPPVQFILRSS